MPQCQGGNLEEYGIFFSYEFTKNSYHNKTQQNHVHILWYTPHYILHCGPMSFMASQITSNSTVYSTVCSVQQHKKHQGSTLLAPPVTSGFPSQRASNLSSVSMWCPHQASQPAGSIISLQISRVQSIATQQQPQPHCQHGSNTTPSTVYWCIASKLKAARNLYWMSNMFFVGGNISFFVCYHVFPKRHSQLDYELNDLLNKRKLNTTRWRWWVFLNIYCDYTMSLGSFDRLA